MIVYLSFHCFQMTPFPLSKPENKNEQNKLLDLHENYR